MSFYSDISPFYDEIFPVDDKEMTFVKEQLEGCSAVLDIGCGTGNKTIHFAASGRKITGIDGDAAMIAEAQKKNSTPGITYKTMDMLLVDAAFEPGSFDAVLCLGNTLVHLNGQREIERLLRKVAGLLTAGGVCIIQILNYERILGKRKLSLPILETENIHFSRFYAWQDEDLRFITHLVIKKTGQEISNNIPLYLLRKGSLAVMLEEAGFKQGDYYGSYQGEPLHSDSFVLIAVAKK